MSFILDCCDREIISFTARQGKGVPAWMVHDEVLLATEKRFGSVDKVNFYVYRDLVLRTWKQRLLHALKRMFTALCQQKSSATELTKI